MKQKAILLIGIACSLVISPLFSKPTVQASPVPVAKIPMTPVKKPLSGHQKQPALQKVHNFTAKELQSFKKMHPNTSVSSHGKIVPFGKQKDWIKKYRAPHLTGRPDSGVSTEAVIGTDNRVQVTDTTAYPYRTIAYIETIHPSGAIYGCTGFFIDDNTIATAAHCIYDTYRNVWFTGATIWPAFDGYTSPYIETFSTDFHVSTAWINVTPPSENSLYLSDVPKDYGVIKVVDGFANLQGIGWLPLRTTNHQVGEQVNVTGYPYDKVGMWKALGYIRALDTYRIDHDADMEQGESGGPIFNSKNGSIAAIGINNAEGTSMNYGARITGNTYNNLQYWSTLSFQP
jgi:glutamyl endopeptidase